ncbi:unnamed protein product, partial [Timema podura]|nr:unnamed protein product [Timema podura]
MSVVVLMDMQSFRKHLVAFLRDLGHELRTNLRVKQDESGKDMIFPWKASAVFNGDTPNMVIGPQSNSNSIVSKFSSSGVIVYLELDNRKCIVLETGECFSSAHEAADYLAATAANHALTTSFPIYQVRAVAGSPVVPADTPTNVKFVFIGFALVVVAGLLIGVITAQKKRAAGITWFLRRIHEDKQVTDIKI